MNTPEHFQALQELIRTVKVGDRIDLVDHDYYKHTGPRVVTGVTDEMLHTQRTRNGVGSYMRWPTDGDPTQDFEVEGRTLKIFNPKHAYVHGNRAIVLELTFHESE